MKYFQRCLTSAPFHLGRSSSAPAARPFTNLSAGGQVAAPCVWSCEAAFWWLHPEGSDPHGRAAASPQGGRGGAAGEALWGALCGEPHFGEQRQRATCCRDQHCFFFFLPTILESQREPPLASPGGKELLLELCAGPQGTALRGTARTTPGAATLSSRARSCPAICTWKCLCLDLLGFESRFS